MSQENKTIEIPAAALPEPTSTKRELTFTVPHILKSLTLDDAGFYHRDVREGGPRQIEFETTQEYADAPAKDEPLFAVRATNQLNFAGSIINVLNDEIELANGFRLVPTSPTATEYLGTIGKRVQVALTCIRDPSISVQQGKDIYRIGRVFTTIP